MVCAQQNTSIRLKSAEPDIVPYLICNSVEVFFRRREAGIGARGVAAVIRDAFAGHAAFDLSVAVIVQNREPGLLSIRV